MVLGVRAFAVDGSSPLASILWFGSDTDRVFGAVQRLSLSVSQRGSCEVLTARVFDQFNAVEI
jgi:hypothetical protein